MLQKRGNFNYILPIVVCLGVSFFLFFLFSTFVLGANNCWSYSIKETCTANSKCTWRDDAWGKGWCEQLDCWSFYSKSNCLNANSTSNLSCIWQQPSAPPGWCTEASCWDFGDRKSTRLNSSHSAKSRMPSSA